MRLTLSFAKRKILFSRKALTSWVMVGILIVIGVLAYIYREPLGKALVFKKAEIQETLVSQPTEVSQMPLEVEKEIIKPEGAPQPEISSPAKEKKVYEETAQKGEGIWHLAKKALEEYLNEKGENVSLTKAHKIYIADYLQKKTGWDWLKPGQKISFSEDLIEEAINQSLKLNQNQLDNILHFTPPPTFVE